MKCPELTPTQSFQNDQSISADELEDFDDLESNFLDVHKSHKDVEQELRGHRDKLGSWIVKNKYFRSSHLNLLTYAEKEQIRHLHDSDREEWTEEKLVASFPATEETIRKIIKAKWLLRDAKQVEQHDVKVQENWTALKENNVPEMGEELRLHLLKFADRKIEAAQVAVEDHREHLKLPMGEFSSIITSCKKPTTTNLAIKAPTNGATKAPLNYGSNSMLMDEVSDHRPMTIELFRDSSGMLRKIDDPVSSPSQPPNHMALGSRTKKVEMRAVPSQFQESATRFHMADQIIIPRNLRRRGGTYKVDDCYFDEDGEFLYRVPGMTK